MIKIKILIHCWQRYTSRIYIRLVGSLLVTDESGRRFRIGTGFSNKERRNPPTVGTLITYKFTGTTKKGLPKFASFLRIYQQF